MDVKWIDGVLRMIYPQVCEVCGRSLCRGEDVMCLHCLRQLPRVSSNGDDFNLLHERLASTVAIERAAGYFHYYKESPYVKLIHQAKYSSRPVVARKIARRFARELSRDGFFDGIDMIVPVPLHRWKLMRRGYNQSDYIARGIADVTGLEVLHSLVASRGHATQTARNSYQRWVNAGSVYELRDGASVAGRHVLVVDDVITTGATLLACCEAIHRVEPSARLSVLALGVAHMS